MGSSTSWTGLGLKNLISMSKLSIGRNIAHQIPAVRTINEWYRFLSHHLVIIITL